jgi:hypothetical protein
LDPLLDIIKDIIIKNQETDQIHRIKSIHFELSSEKEKPVITALLQILDSHDLYVLQETIDKIESEILVAMSSDEERCYKELKAKMTVIKSDPSERFMGLGTRCWKYQNKIEFGTADKYNMIILTGNQGAVKNILYHNGWTEMEPFIKVHRSRDVVGHKLSKFDVYY